MRASRSFYTGRGDIGKNGPALDGAAFADEEDLVERGFDRGSPDADDGPRRLARVGVRFTNRIGRGRYLPRRLLAG